MIISNMTYNDVYNNKDIMMIINSYKVFTPVTKE